MIKEVYSVDTLTDVHTVEQINQIVQEYNDVIDVLQIPAFLCRQTDLLQAACATDKIVNIKKGQFLAPWDMAGILTKAEGAKEVWITERGTSFGYNTLVVDFTGLQYMLDNFSEPVDVPEEDGIRFVWRDGQHSMITTQDSPFAIVHYSLEDFLRVRKFYEYVLEIPVLEVDINKDGSGRYRLHDISGRIDLEVRRDIKRLDLRAWGKHYPAANHFRLIERDIPRISARLEETGLGGWLIPPEGPFGFIFGPTSETIETFDLR
jgi:hypothetical protein